MARTAWEKKKIGEGLEQISVLSNVQNTESDDVATSGYDA